MESFTTRRRYEGSKHGSICYQRRATKTKEEEEEEEENWKV